MHRLYTSARGLLALGLVLLLGLGSVGCDHTTVPDGPNLIDRFGPFRLVTPLAASQATVDFASGENVVFTAEFNKQVAWTLEITGQQSGAVKRIEGFSNALNADNARWRGGTTDLPFFKDEPVEAVILIPDEDPQDPADVTVAVDVTAPRTYPGNIVADFEGGDNITVGNFEFEFEGAGISSEVPAGEGDSFYLLRGTDDVVPNFFTGLIDIRPSGGDSFFDIPTSVPEDLYFNMMIRSFETDFTIAVVQLIADGNGSGGFEDGQDTVFPFGDIVVGFDEGWRLFSNSLEALGMTQQQAQEIVAVRVLLISDNNAQPTPPLQVTYGIDYITFTAGGPLEP